MLVRAVCFSADLLPYRPEFNLSAIISVVIIFMVSAAETIGDSTALVAGGLGREITEKEISGALACDGFCKFYFRIIWMSAGYFLQPERRPGQYDKSSQPFYHYDRCCIYDSCRSVSANR